MRLVYFGSGAFGLPTLRHLWSHHEVLAVVSQPDRSAGRGRKDGSLTPTPIAEWVAANHPGTPLLKPEKVNEATVLETIRAFDAQAWVVIAFGQKLSQRLLADRFAINLHASLLPRWRGAAPINAAILGGDRVTGNTVITLADRMDAGLILGQSTRAIEPEVTAGELHDTLAADGPALVERVLEEFRTNSLHPVHQVEQDVTIATKLGRDDDNFDPRQPAEFLRREVHALTPWPGIGVTFTYPAVPNSRGIDVKLRRVRAVEQSHTDAAPGKLFDPTRGLCACGNGSVLEILELQPVGRNQMKWADFIRGAGRTLTPETVLVSTRELAS